MTGLSSPAAPPRGGVEIAPMRRRHLRAVLRIESHTDHEGWSLGLYLGELRRPEGRTYLVAKVDGRVVGFGGILFIADDGHVTNIAVDPAVRRRGIATRLLLALIRDAIDEGSTAVTLEVGVHNRGAQALYRRFGFAPAGVRRNYYRGSGEDAMVMWVHDVDTPAYRDRLAAIAAALAGAPDHDQAGSP
jgi:ribosomal-protein-alanine N-acetyltransferase